MAKAKAEATEFEGGESLVVDMREVEELKFENLPRGDYPAEISDINFKYSKNGGNPMWEVVVEVNDGDHAGRKLFTYVTFSEKAMPFAKQTLARIAPELLEGPFDPSDAEVLNSLLGRACVVKVDIQTYENEPRNRVKGLYAAKDSSDFMG